MNWFVRLLPSSFRLLPAVALLWLVAPSAARAGGFEQQWARGSVILSTGDTVDGPVVLHHDEETLEVRLFDGTTRTFPAVNVRYFIVTNEAPQRNLNSMYNVYNYGMRGPYGLTPGMWSNQRTDTSGVKLFVTYLWNHDNDYSDFRSPAFFQQLTDGNIRLLKRERIIQRMMSPMDPYYRYSMAPGMGGYYTEIQSSYFLADPQGNLRALRNLKKDFLAYFGKNSKKIQAYVKENRLRFNEPYELLLIMRYADSLGVG
jgi:hypothetical protein